jgi:hypothetical protein
MNKVLNRPMFRKVALQRGDLKPIHANTGVMVGSSGPNINYGPPNPRFQISTEVKPQGFFRKLGREFSQSRRGIQQIMNPKSPQFTAKGTLGSGRLIPGLLGVEGVHSVVDPVVGQYMKEGIPRDLVSYGISGLASLNPYVRAAGLGKLAYEDAQKQKGVPLTPLTTMSPTGRYNIEAEIARRMGQPAPNPVEFGLLPAGTIPELSGGKPVGMQEGGSVEPTQEVIEEAMEVVRLAEQEPAIKDTPEYQEALNILQRQMLLRLLWVQDLLWVESNHSEIHWLALLVELHQQLEV